MRISKIKDTSVSKKVRSEYIEIELHKEMYEDNFNIAEDPKEFRKFLIRCKYLIRNSYEYKKLIRFLKYSKGMNYCGIHPNVKAKNGYKIEIHHSPFVLEDIVYVVINKRTKNNEDIKMSSIAEEVMKLHYAGVVGLYPLCETCHKYAHGEANDLFIPLSSLWGDPVSFYELYKEWFPETLDTKFQCVMEANKGYNIMTQNISSGLIKKYIYINASEDGDSELLVPSSSKLIDFLNDI